MSTLINNGNNVFYTGTTVSSEKLIEQGIRNELTRQKMEAYNKLVADVQEMVTQTTGTTPFMLPKRRSRRLLLLLL